VVYFKAFAYIGFHRVMVLFDGSCGTEYIAPTLTQVIVPITSPFLRIPNLFTYPSFFLHFIGLPHRFPLLKASSYDHKCLPLFQSFLQCLSLLLLIRPRWKATFPVSIFTFNCSFDKDTLISCFSFYKVLINLL